MRLYDLPPEPARVGAVRAAGVIVRRPLPHEKTNVLNWIETHFRTGWRDEADVAFARQPVGCFIATEQGQIVGFAVIESTMRGFFGPTGVAESHRRRGIGEWLLRASLIALRDIGYAYAIIGGATRPSALAFYKQAVGATEIEGSVPGVYADPLVPVPPAPVGSGGEKIGVRG